MDIPQNNIENNNQNENNVQNNANNFQNQQQNFEQNVQNPELFEYIVKGFLMMISLFVDVTLQTKMKQK